MFSIFFSSHLSRYLGDTSEQNKALSHESCVLETEGWQTTTSIMIIKLCGNEKVTSAALGRGQEGVAQHRQNWLKKDQNIVFQLKWMAKVDDPDKAALGSNLKLWNKSGHPYGK